MAKAVRAKKSGVTTKKAKAPKAKAAKATKKPATTKKAAAAKKAAPKKTAPKKAKPAAKKATKKAAKPAPNKAAPKKKPTPKKAAPAKAAAKPKKAPAKPASKPAAKKVAAKPKAAPKPKAPPAVAAAGVVAQQTAAAQATPVPPRPSVGERAPDFSLPADDGGTVSLGGLAGKKVVLYFYPKDDTPGCTIEAIAFSAQKAAFEAVGAVVLGVSKDSIDDHCKFKSKHSLSIPLLSDESGEMLEKYGVWVEKNLYGRTYMGIDRTTFLIDGQGIIRKVWPKVRVEGHADEVLEAVKSL